MSLKTAFMTLNSTIPSRKANSVSVMKTCVQMARHGLDIELVVPRRKRSVSEKLLEGKSVWDFYTVPKNFIITNLPCPTIWRHPRYLGYTIFAVSYVFFKGNSLVYARHIELAYLAALYGRMSIFESHNFLKTSKHPLLPYWINILKNPARSAAMVVTTHASAKAYKTMGVPPEKILVAPNGADVNKFNVSESKETIKNFLGLPQDKTIVGFCGHLYKGRGIEELLECAKVLDHIFFVIVGGEPDDVSRYTFLSKELNLSNIEFVGFVPQASVPNYLLSSDILVMPYTSATGSHNFMSPMKMFDYLASGRPIVATDFPIVREILQDKYNAILVPFDSSKALVSGIKWLLDNPEAARKIGEQAGRDAIQYSWENRAARIVSWLKNLFSI